MTKAMVISCCPSPYIVPNSHPKGRDCDKEEEKTSEELIPTPTPATTTKTTVPLKEERNEEKFLSGQFEQSNKDEKRKERVGNVE